MLFAAIWTLLTGLEATAQGQAGAEVPGPGYRNGSSLVGPAMMSYVPDPAWQVVGIGDFNGDGRADLVWRNTTTGENRVWYTGGSGVHVGFVGSAMITPVTDQAWQIVGIGDFNGDGQPDLVWRNTATGDNAVWYMNGSSLVGSAMMLPLTDLNWKIVGIGDFNGDGKPDLVWRNTTTGQNGVWYMDGSIVVGGAYMPSQTDLNWQIVGIGDFNGDGKPDLFWWDNYQQRHVVWYMNGSSLVGSENLSNFNPGLRYSWIGDFNGDGKPDLLRCYGSAGQFEVTYYNTSNVDVALSPLEDHYWQIVGIGDFNGDGKPDLVWRKTTTGDNAVWYMNGTSLIGSGYMPSQTDFQMVGIGDFNADGKPDLVWRYPQMGWNQVWYMNGSSLVGSDTLKLAIELHGEHGEYEQPWKIVGIADFNGDGKPDLVWRNKSTGDNAVWYMNGLSYVGSAMLPALPDQAWQIVGIGDFNGDGKPDLVWRNTTTGYDAVWYMNGVTYLGAAMITLGGTAITTSLSWQIMGIGDFNGDGMPDLVWRNPTTGDNAVWYMNGTSVVGWDLMPSVID
jgi:FG-GAP-like repeat/FG-GAP repeat